MNLTINGNTISLDTLLSKYRTIISLGRQTSEAYNVVAIDEESVDVFQCQIKRSGDGWLVQNGQWRTECPKGIRSQLQHACSMCMGRCVNTRPANPTYSWRIPARPTLLCGNPIPSEGSMLHAGDVLQCGNIEIGVLDV